MGKTDWAAWVERVEAAGGNSRNPRAPRWLRLVKPLCESHRERASRNKRIIENEHLEEAGRERGGINANTILSRGQFRNLVKAIPVGEVEGFVRVALAVAIEIDEEEHIGNAALAAINHAIAVLIEPDGYRRPKASPP
jgi:hypothetical protein